MKPRKSSDIISTLTKKGFVLDNSRKKHQFYFLWVDGKKQSIFTFFSHDGKEYGNSLMTKVSKQMHFPTNSKAEEFFDCTLSKEGYAQMLCDNGDI